MAADRETYRGDVSGVPEDLHGPLSSLDFHEIETTGVGNRHHCDFKQKALY